MNGSNVRKWEFWVRGFFFLTAAIGILIAGCCETKEPKRKTGSWWCHVDTPHVTITNMDHKKAKDKKKERQIHKQAKTHIGK